MPDANKPTYEALEARIAHLESDLVTVSAQLAVVSKERDLAEAELIIARTNLPDHVARQLKRLTTNSDAERP